MGTKHPARKALDLCDRALYPYVEREERLGIAAQALDLSEDCSTAYTILAWEQERLNRPHEAMALHEEALRAAERALEDVVARRRARRRRPFRKPGEFPEAVAYARSRLALAKALREAGRLDEAIAHARAVFDANEDDETDPFGASVFLIPWLEEKEREEYLPPEDGLPESVNLSDNLRWVGREDFEVLGPWGGKTDYEMAHDRAQDVLYDSYEYPAWDADPDFQERSAREALGICPDMADAHVILGLVAKECDAGLEEARSHFEAGVAAGERSVTKLRGEDAFERERGNFYGILETRGYARARYNLCVLLYDLG